jgi:hypothetical protein
MAMERGDLAGARWRLGDGGRWQSESMLRWHLHDWQEIRATLTHEEKVGLKMAT